ncbi:MAG: tRNA guanosine(34) transglycosylase Tgt [candidate division SR1 bacterium]|nr:tRNA guanosine(34) transglycosylase Tgt [candidate division SR1 bacterium]
MKRDLFKIVKKSEKTKARAGILSLSHGDVLTPIFMPIGTQGTVKSLTFTDLEELNAQIILGNTYHLWLRPDLDVLSSAGGLHNFSSWKRPILTDSGGFQAFSLTKISKFTEEGVEFRSHLNGEKRFLSPEKSISIQTIIGSDIALVLDECLPAEITYEVARKAMERTIRWAQRSKDEFEKLRLETNHYNNLFGIPQGAQFEVLRRESARLTKELDFSGYSIGGVANGGEPEETMYSQVLSQTEILEEYKPRHLLGVGTPKDIVQMVARGIDMFDCVMPTRNARHGSLFIGVGDSQYRTLRILKNENATDFSPINENSKFIELRTYSKAYLRHLFVSKELLAYRLATLNNLEYYLNLTELIRDKISSDQFDSWWEGFCEVK